MLSHEAVRLEERRLVIDIPRFVLGSQTIGARHHRLLKQIRMGYHSDKVRLVFDLGNRADYVSSLRSHAYCDVERWLLARCF